MRHAMTVMPAATWLMLSATAGAESLLANPKLRGGADGTVENWTLHDPWAKGQTARRPALSEGKLLLGKGGDYRLTSAPLPVREDTWLRAGGCNQRSAHATCGISPA